jgi:SAM-dependent methyltransferase
MAIPWWGKIAAKVVLGRLPFGYRVWQRLGLFRHGAMDDSAYALGVFDTHVRRGYLTGQLSGKTLLELGPGDSVATAVIAKAHGATAWLVDTGAFVRQDLQPYQELAAALAARGLAPPNLERCGSIEQLLDRCGARYWTNGLEDLQTLPSGSVDLIFSHAVLEHVERDTFADTIRECRRLLKSGGRCSHQVDLRDHLGGALNNLRFSEALWESPLFARSGFYTNRIRYHEMLDLFRRARFDVVATETTRWDELPTPRQKLAAMFQGLPDDDLCVSSFHVLLE